jgi:hypothetical protein
MGGGFESLFIFDWGIVPFLIWVVIWLILAWLVERARNA